VAGKRTRLGRTPTLILRNTVGDSYAIEATADPPSPHEPESGSSGDLSFEYEDGNGMWISSGVSVDKS